MGNGAGKISAPVNTDDISTVLGVASHDVATLCTHERNNKWSKKKPVRGESPVEYSEPWNRNTGNVRSVVGCPIYWGMTLPFNTSQQTGLSAHQRWLRPLAYRAVYGGGNVKSYEYAKPVVGTDFCRMTDYVGYNHKAPEGWTCGVQGATDIAGSSSIGSPGMLLQVDTFDTAEIGFYIGMPSESISDDCLSFKDLYDFQGYRFIAELYNSADISKDTAGPVAVLVCTTDIASMTFGATFSILVPRINTLFNFQGDGEKTFYAVLGVVRFSENPTLTEEKRKNNTGMGCAVLASGDYAKIANGDGSIPPWNLTHKPFLCQIKLQSYSKVFLQVLKYAKLIPTNDTYKDLPASANSSYGSDGFRLQVTVQNKGTSSITLNGGSVGSGVQPPIFQIQATGAFDTNDPSYATKCLSPVEGKWHDVKIFKDGACTDSGTITIASNASATAYFKCEGVMPIGRTSGFTFRVSTDNGKNWVITGRFSAAFLVTT